MTDNNFKTLVASITGASHYFQLQAQKQVNVALTLRNWMIGAYLVEYELHGSDRAVYGQGLFKELTRQLEQQGLKQIRERHLYLCKDFYLAYPQILRTVTAESYLVDFQSDAILRTLSAKLPALQAPTETEVAPPAQWATDPNLIINRLSFSHIIELLKADSALKRAFYEGQALQNIFLAQGLKRKAAGCGQFRQLRVCHEFQGSLGRGQDRLHRVRGLADKGFVFRKGCVIRVLRHEGIEAAPITEVIEEVVEVRQVHHFFITRALQRADEKG